MNKIFYLKFFCLFEVFMFHLQHLDFRAFHECKNFKISYVIIDMIVSKGSYNYIFNCYLGIEPSPPNHAKFL